MISKQPFESLYEMQKREKNVVYENTNMHTHPSYFLLRLAMLCKSLKRAKIISQWSEMHEV